jgi:hypothetical protein
MTILEKISSDMHLDKLQGVTHHQVKNAFLANYLAALMLLRLQDLKGLMLINDPHHSKLTKFTKEMSGLNFWAKACCYPGQEVKSRMQPGHYDLLSMGNQGILDSRIQKMMAVPYSPPEMINWVETVGSLLMMKLRHGVSSSYVDQVAGYLIRWENLTDNEKKRAVTQAFMYLVQSDPHSVMLPRLRDLSSITALKGPSSVAQKLVGFKKLQVKEDVDTGAGSIASGDNAIISGGHPEQKGADDVLANVYKLKSLAPNQVEKKGKWKIKNGKIIRLRAKTFKARVFKAPDSMRGKNE